MLKTIFETHLASALTAPALADLDRVEATGPLTAVFKMKAPWATFPSSLTGQLGMVPQPEDAGRPERHRAARSAPVRSR